MRKTAPKTLALSGRVFDRRPLVASLGDVFISPGANRTGYIDASISDGQTWRALRLSSFGGLPRQFEHPGEIGPVMRGIQARLEQYGGLPLHYERQEFSSKSSYAFHGVPFRPQW